VGARIKVNPRLGATLVAGRTIEPIHLLVARDSIREGGRHKREYGGGSWDSDDDDEDEDEGERFNTSATR
jgi:hypothetical protein